MAQQQTVSDADALAPRTLDVPRLVDWINGAQPNARLVYFHGRFADDGSKSLNERLHREAERGMIYLVQDKRTEDHWGWDYVAVRSSRPADPRVLVWPTPVEKLAQAAATSPKVVDFEASRRAR